MKIKKIKCKKYKKRLNELGVHEGESYTVQDRSSFVILYGRHSRIGLSKILFNKLEIE